MANLEVPERVKVYRPENARSLMKSVRCTWRNCAFLLPAVGLGVSRCCFLEWRAALVTIQTLQSASTSSFLLSPYAPTSLDNTGQSYLAKRWQVCTLRGFRREPVTTIGLEQPLLRSNRCPVSSGLAERCVRASPATACCSLCPRGKTPSVSKCDTYHCHDRDETLLCLTQGRLASHGFAVGITLRSAQITDSLTSGENALRSLLWATSFTKVVDASRDFTETNSSHST